MTDTTRDSVERFDPDYEPGCYDYAPQSYMRMDNDGGWVSVDDYTAILTRAEAAEAERDALQAKLAVAVEALTETTKALDDIINGEEFGESDSKKARARLHKSIRTIAQLTAAPKEGKDDDQ